MHPGDHAMAQSADSYLEAFGFHQLVQDKNLHRLYLEKINYRSITVTGPLSDGQIIDLGHTRLQVLHLPGHSAGHCGFLFLKEGFVFTADLDLSGFGPWYGNLNCRLDHLLDSMDRLIRLKPDYLVTGHGQAVVKEKIPTRLKAYRDIVYARENRIIDCLRRGCHTVMEIARCLPVYQKLPPPQPVFFLYEYVMDMIHLNHLMACNRVVCENQRFYLTG